MTVQLVSIGELVRAHYGKALKDSDRRGGGQHDVYGSSGIIGRHDHCLVPYPTIVIGRKGSVGSVTFAPNGGWPIDTAFFIELREPGRADLRYLYWALSNARLDRRAITTSIPGLNRDELYRAKIRLPALSEQHRIAAMLDKADAVRQKRRESATLLHQLLNSIFLDLFGDPIQNDRAWPQLMLRDIASVERGKFSPRPRNDPRYYGGPHPFVQTGDISRSDGTLRQWQQTLNEAGTSVSRMFPRGTIAMAIAANIGDTAIVEFDFYCPDSVVGIAAHSELVLAEYLEFCLRFFKARLQATAPKTAQRNINLQVLRPLRVPVPAIELQARFVNYRHRLTRLGERYSHGLLELESLQSSLSHDAFFK